MFGLGPMMGNCTAPVYKDILDKCVVPALWQRFGEGPHMSAMVNGHTVYLSSNQTILQECLFFFAPLNQAYKDILDKCVVAALWQKFGEGPHMSVMVNGHTVYLSSNQTILRECLFLLHH